MSTGAEDPGEVLGRERAGMNGKQQSSRPPDCHCDYSPNSTGPEEDCPHHGRPYAYWVKRHDALAARLASVPRCAWHNGGYPDLCWWCGLNAAVLGSEQKETGEVTCAGCGATAPAGTEGWRGTDAPWCPQCAWLA